MIDWTGVFPAVTTKMTEDGGLDLPAFQASIDRLIVNGVSGIIVLPMLGLLPALGILTPATRHPPRRNLLMIAAHVVWGATLGLLTEKFHATRRSARRNCRSTVRAAEGEESWPPHGRPESPPPAQCDCRRPSPYAGRPA